MKWCVAVVLCAGPGFAAEPLFRDMSNGLPRPHVYSGGWTHFVGGGVAVFDCNGDARPEIFAAGGASAATLFINETNGPEEPLTFSLGELPGDLFNVAGAYPLDIDSDGLLDLFVMRVGGNIALRGLGSCRFKDATSDWGITPGNAWTTAFAATWEAGNRWPTLAIGNYVDRDAPDGPFEACDANQLLRPGKNRFDSPIDLEPGYCALSMLISDWTRSGRADLRISNDRHYYVRDGYEQMWRLDELRSLGSDDDWDRLSIWGMGIASHDLSGDGRPEVFLTSMGDQILKLSDGDTGFSHAPFSIGTYAQRPHVGDDGRPSTGWHAEFGDVDNDGRMDLFIAKGNVDQMPGNAMEDPNNLLIQRPDGRFEERSVVAGVATVERARGAALADLDGDGRLDLVVVNRRAPMEVWQNVTEDTGNWLAVDVKQAGVNTQAVGAWVEVRTALGGQEQEITVGGGHAGGEALPLHFGLGDADEARLRVIWPDGQISDWQTVLVDQQVLVSR